MYVYEYMPFAYTVQCIEAHTNREYYIQILNLVFIKSDFEHASFSGNIRLSHFVRVSNEFTC